MFQEEEEVTTRQCSQPAMVTKHGGYMAFLSVSILKVGWYLSYTLNRNFYILILQVP